MMMVAVDAPDDDVADAAAVLASSARNSPLHDDAAAARDAAIAGLQFGHSPTHSPPPPPPPPPRSSSDGGESSSSSPGLRRRRHASSSPPSSNLLPSPPPGPVSSLDDDDDNDGGGTGDDAGRRRRQPRPQRRRRRRRETTTGIDDDCDYDNNYDDDNDYDDYDENVEDGITDHHRHYHSATQREFWRNYDTVIMLSICSVLGIFMRMMSATWFRLELGAVFSEDSALGTNLPLNVWSCFLLGLLCSGGDAMGIVYSKVLGGGGPGTHGGGSGSGMWRAGMGVSGSMINAVRAGMNRARRRGRRRSRGDRRDDIVRDRVDDVEWNDDYDDEDDNDPSSQISDIEAEEIGTTARRRRCNGHQDVDDRDHDERVAKTTFEPSPPPPSPLPRSRGNLDRAVPEYTESTIAGLLGLDDEFRIAGVGRGGYDDGNGEDEIRQVQLRGLSRRIMASPSIAFFPARKEANDVLEHYECGSSISRDSQLGDVMADDTTDARMRKIGMGEVSPSDVGGEDMPGRRDGARDGRATGQSSKSRTEPQNANPSGNANGPSSDVYRKLSDIGGRVVTYRRLQILEGWNSGTSPEEMKHIILLGLRLGFCGALGTFASLNASVILLLKSGKIGEALVGYAISIQLGIVSYRWGQYLAVYIFVWRCRLEERRAEKRGYGLRLRRLDSDEEEASDATSARKRYIISVRSLATVLFVAMFVSLGLAIYFFPSRRQYFISLIFTPFGCLARWKLMTKYNKYMPGFPLGTFACNIGGCALSGSLTSFLAGNLSSEETSVLHSMIAGFAGALSTFSAFIVEILSLMDPIIFKFDGMVYAMITVLWAVIVGIIGGQAKNWADEI